MDELYLISCDNGHSSKGPFPLPQIQSMYLNNRIPLETLIKPATGTEWLQVREFDPALVAQRSASHSVINAAIEASHKESIREERSAIWNGLYAFLAGTLITIFTYKAASESPSGGTYIIAYGPILGGFMAFVYGLVSTIQRHLEKKRQARATAPLSPEA